MEIGILLPEATLNPLLGWKSWTGDALKNASNGPAAQLDTLHTLTRLTPQLPCATRSSMRSGVCVAKLQKKSVLGPSGMLRAALVLVNYQRLLSVDATGRAQRVVHCCETNTEQVWRLVSTLCAQLYIPACYVQPMSAKP